MTFPIDKTTYEWQSMSSGSYSTNFGYSPSGENFVNQLPEATLFIGMPSVQLKERLSRLETITKIVDCLSFDSTNRHPLIFSYEALGHIVNTTNDIRYHFLCLEQLLTSNGIAKLRLRGSLKDYYQESLLDASMAKEFQKKNTVMKCKLQSGEHGCYYDLAQICENYNLSYRLIPVAEYTMKSMLNSRGEVDKNGSYPILVEIQKLPEA